MEIPILRQCELLGISKSGYYYQPQGERNGTTILDSDISGLAAL